MKKTSLVYLLMFMLAFVLPSFSIIPEKESDNNFVQATSDSVTVSVKFSNPELIFTDDRSSIEEILTLQQLTNKELVDVVKEFNSNFNKLTELQERRYGPALALLEQRTGYSVGQINKFIVKDRKLSVGYIFISCLYIGALLIIYNTSYRRLRELIIAPLLIASFVYVSLLFIWKALVPLNAGIDYTIFYKLIELSPF